MSGENANAGDIVGGRFTLERVLGEGSFGRVWSARDQTNESHVALKLLQRRLAQKPRMLERFAREASLLETLDHPNIVKAVAWSAELPEVYLALELLDGRTLNDELLELARRREYLPQERLLLLAREICEAVDHAHRQGVVHRDLKPHNVMLTAASVKVLDFGIAKILDTDASESTTHGRVLGTLLYLAPEQIQGGDVDERADIFALGAVLFEMLTLNKAWRRDARSDADARMEIVQRILRGARPRASLMRPGLGTAVDEVLIRALAINREDRYPNALELYAAFERALASPISDTIVDTTMDPPRLIAIDLSTASGLPVDPLGRSLTPVMPVDLDVGTSGADWTRESRSRGKIELAVGPSPVKPGRPEQPEQPQNRRRAVLLAGSISLVLGAASAYLYAWTMRPEPLQMRRIEAQLPAPVELRPPQPTPQPEPELEPQPQPTASRPLKKQVIEVSFDEPAPEKIVIDRSLVSVFAAFAKAKTNHENVELKRRLAELINAHAAALLPAAEVPLIHSCVARAAMLDDPTAAMSAFDRCIQRLRTAVRAQSAR